MRTYECLNLDCALGTVGTPGRFTGNRGVCPNCGAPGWLPDDPDLEAALATYRALVLDALEKREEIPS